MAGKTEVSLNRNPGTTSALPKPADLLEHRIGMIGELVCVSQIPLPKTLQMT